MSSFSGYLPSFLESYIEFRQHLEALYENLENNTQKGEDFAKLSKNLLSTREDFFKLHSQLNPKKSHDQGVDILWIDPETNMPTAYCQSKLCIRSKDDIDNIIGKFASFENSQISTQKEPIQTNLLDLLEENNKYSDRSFIEENKNVKYYISTLSSIKNILKLYENSGRPSVSFYRQLISSKRIEIIDGEPLYKLFLEAYRREYAIPQRVKFRSLEKFVNYNNVYIGIISANDLIKIYSDCGKGIFFENVRDFLGLDERSSVLEINNEIFKTARDEPEKMLERNNGITFKASSLKYEDESESVILENAGIINGCQTTMCIVEAQPSGDCFVPIKIVLADIENSSTVAKTANNQNKIEKINLELSEYLRPQLVKMSLAEIGVKINETENSNSVPSIASSICNNRIFYSDLRYLFIGLFSYIPRNIFISDYASIKFDDVGSSYPSLDEKKYLISVLGKILEVANQVFDSLKQEYPPEASNQDSKGKTGTIFNRFYADEKGYKAYLIVFALCCLLNIDDEKQFKNMSVKNILEQVSQVNENRKEEFRQTLIKAFKSVAICVINRFSGKDRDLDKEIKQQLFNYLKSTEFSSFYLTYGML